MGSPSLRATHRADRPGLPPLYCLRVADAESALVEGASISVLVRDSRTDLESWQFWRAS